jgi:hypothetical protein
MQVVAGIGIIGVSMIADINTRGLVTIALLLLRIINRNGRANAYTWTP